MTGDGRDVVPRAVVEGELDLDAKPFGAPELPVTRRDRFAVWLHQHRWALVAVRITGGLAFLGLAVLVLGSDFEVWKVVSFILGVAFAGEAGDREDERGETILEELRSGGLIEPNEGIPAEFRAHVPRRPDPRNDGRPFRGGF